MSSEVAARAFDPFFTTKPVGKGTGLGLSMVYGVARQSGGRAGIRSEAGVGTTVSILLPETAAPGGAATVPSAPGETRAASTVLVVDDDPEVRELTVSMLEELGHTVLEAPDGRQALRLLERHSTDLILLDYAMPEMNGAEVAAAIRQRGIPAPIVFATGFADSDAIRKALEREPFVLRKPYSLAELSNILETAQQRT